MLTGSMLAGCTPKELTINEAWARPASAGGNSAVFFVIDNQTTEDDVLLMASTDVATAELHLSMMEGEVMKMMPQESVAVPANTAVEFKPGSFHVMLIGLEKDLLVGETVTVELQFEKAGEITVIAPIKEQ